jgi:hypothetical protein
MPGNNKKNNIHFERKLVNGVPNPKYVDLLIEDKPLSGQKFACFSFCSPEKILKQKEMFFFEEFLKKWDFNKSMEKFIQFLDFISYKYNLDFKDVSSDFTDFIKEEKQNLINANMSDEYKTFLDNNEETLQQKFDIEHKFQTNVRGVKVRGCYPTLEEAKLRCKMLREVDDSNDIFVGEVGIWMSWDPEAYKTGEVEYMEEELNQLMHEKHKNEIHAKAAFEQRTKESKQKAMEENMKNAEKSGNTLTQTIDANGNLIGVNNMQDNENISTADICNELFEGENIVVGKTDNGQSQLISGPFANKKR